MSVETVSRFIEYQQLRFSQQRARECDALAFSTGNRGTAIANLRLNSSSFAFPFGSALPVRIHLVTLAAGCLAALGAVVARHSVQADNEAAALRLDRWALPLFVAGYLVVVGWMILGAVLYR